MALDFKVTSPTQPGVSNVSGGTITVTDNGDGTWELTSSNTITTFRFDTNKTDVSEVQVISEDLTSASNMFYGMTGMTTFSCASTDFSG